MSTPITEFQGLELHDVLHRLNSPSGFLGFRSETALNLLTKIIPRYGVTVTVTERES